MTTTSLDTNPVIIRRANEADFPRFLMMIHALAAFNADQATIGLDELRRDLLGPSPWLIILVASIDHLVIGYAALCPLAQLQFGKRGLDIHHLFVEEGYRGQGIGKKLIAASIQEATQLGCSFVKIGTSAHNIIAQKAYLASGFEQEAARGPRFKMNLTPFSPPSSS